MLKWVNESLLIVKKGMTGATGNIYTGLLEFEDMSFLLHMLRQNDLFVDVGANVGVYTILCGAVARAKCISIEPIPATFDYLWKNIIVNEINDLTTAHNIGVSSKEQVLTFTEDLGPMNRVITVGTTYPPMNTVEVKVKSLDEIIGESQPSLIKIDVEGLETEVIAGAHNVMSRASLHAVIMELNGSGTYYGYDETKLRNKMSGYGFAPFRYSPFDRLLIPTSGMKNQSGNTLYIKNLDYVRERLIKAGAFRINGLSI
ncbi:MAG: FkbM family methyltransferase [Nitrospiraceae bacterium]|nr:FkbM family methyltransferase [Nitrospiraceae bacterium]